MPGVDSWWGKTLCWGYAAGYWIYIVTVAVVLWREHSLFDWLSFVFVQAVVATFWPIATYLWYSGYFS